jgi:tRNA-Thr(GGU) m(6)t(6)A37 methyltransferase TsaA
MRDVEPLRIIPIGVVANGERAPVRVEWSGVESEIRLREGLGEALLGLDSYSYVIVIGWLHLVPGELRERMRAHPAGDERLPLQGALSLRGAPRPNPLSVTVCRLVSMNGDMLRVRGLDLIDGTPVLDVKPYVPFYDAVPDASIPNWALDG